MKTTVLLAWLFTTCSLFLPIVSAIKDVYAAAIPYIPAMQILSIALAITASIVSMRKNRKQ